MIIKIRISPIIIAAVLSIALQPGYGQENSEKQHLIKLDSSLSDLNDQKKVAYINQNFYKIYSADFNTAKELTSWAVEVSNSNHWTLKEGYALMNYGVVLYLKGEYDQALPAYLASLHLFDSLKHDKGKAMLFTEMANYYQKIGHKEKMLGFLDRAEIISKSIDDKATLAKSYGMRATFLYRDGFINEAKDYYFKNYEINLILKDSIGLGYVLLDLAKYAQREGDFQQALNYIDESTKIRELIGDEQAIAENLDFLGDSYLREGKYNQAIKYYKQCIHQARKVNYPDQVRKAFQQLMVAYKKTENYELASIYQDSAYLLKDSLFNIARTKTIEELQTKYETGKKEQQLVIKDLELAEQKNTIQQNNFLVIGLIVVVIFVIILALLLRGRMQKKQQLILRQRELDFRESQLNAVIDSQEKERKRFASDLHDGFGQLISVLKMNVAAINKEDATAEKKNELFEKSTEILNGMYDELRGICFNLMPHTLVQQGLVAALQEFAGRINLSEKVNIEVLVFDFEERLNDLKEISIYRIVQEWVNNILKYGDATKITIQLTKDDKEITLTVEDNGHGFEKNLLIEGKGNGWKNMNSRSNLIKGILEIDTDPQLSGSTLILNIPEQKKQIKEVITS